MNNMDCFGHYSQLCWYKWRRYWESKKMARKMTVKEVCKVLGGYVVEIVKEKKPEITYSIGDTFRDRTTGDLYMLIQSEASHVCLVSLKHGNRFKDSQSVEDIHKITQREFDKICGGFSTFTKVNLKISEV